MGLKIPLVCWTFSWAPEMPKRLFCGVSQSSEKEDIADADSAPRDPVAESQEKALPSGVPVFVTFSVSPTKEKGVEVGDRKGSM